MLFFSTKYIPLVESRKRLLSPSNGIIILASISNIPQMLDPLEELLLDRKKNTKIEHQQGGGGKKGEKRRETKIKSLEDVEKVNRMKTHAILSKAKTSGTFVKNPTHLRE